MVLALVAGTPSAAHTGDQSYLYVDVTASTLTGRIEVPYADLEAVLGIEIRGSEAEIQNALGANREAITAYLEEHLQFVGPDARPWPITFAAPTVFRPDDVEENADYAVIDFEVDAGGEIPRIFEVRFDPFLDELFGRSHLMLVQNDWRAGVFDGDEVLLTFFPSTRSQVADLGDASAWRNLSSSVGLGIEHIETGPDHILFLLALILPSVLVREPTGWRPTAGFGSALSRILRIVTMFTVAHSITFTLAGLGLLPLPPSRLVESIIGLSVAATALHNLRPVITNREWVLSFGFGLFHGMGFASLTASLDVTRSTQLVSLLGRNIGIEIGQAIVIVLLFPAVFLLRRLALYLPLMRAISIVLALLATGWAVERAFGVNLGVDRVVEPLFVYPRAFIVAVLISGVAAVLYAQATWRGELR